MRKHIIAVICAVLTAVGAAATTLDITTTDFTPGGEIKSSSFLTMASEIETWANGNVAVDNIPDSGLTSNFFAAGAINATHIANRNVRSQHIDSGAIAYDTQFAVGAISANAIADSSITDTKIANNTIQWWDLHYRGADTLAIRQMPPRCEIIRYTGNGGGGDSYTTTTLSKIVAVQLTNTNTLAMYTAAFDMNWVYLPNAGGEVSITSDTQWSTSSGGDGSSNIYIAYVWGY